ncbi:MAG: tRNA (guanosine(46)-N7)-methyltransferase TrmB [Chlorobi bacterium]|nr:tRNA (guanosine(46)-N7)-methyltransferase TrmB [Chlorobiota bacterium]
MGRKNKSARWADLEQLEFVFQPPMVDVFGKDFHLKGKWHNFFKNQNPIVLELGCGKGEYTVGLAKMFPEQNFIGVDIKGARIWRGAITAQNEQLKNVAFIRTRVEWIHAFFDTKEVDEIWLTFPDPQLKKRRTKKRLTHPLFLNRYNTFLKPTGKIHLKTDNYDLYFYTQKVIRFNKLPIHINTDDLYQWSQTHPARQIQTFYEQKFLDQGMKIYYIQFSVPEKKIIKDIPDDSE